MSTSTTYLYLPVQSSPLGQPRETLLPVRAAGGCHRPGALQVPYKSMVKCAAVGVMTTKEATTCRGYLG
jgi:hypothetical protein